MNPSPLRQLIRTAQGAPPPATSMCRERSARFSDLPHFASANSKNGPIRPLRFARPPKKLARAEASFPIPGSNSGCPKKPPVKNHLFYRRNLASFYPCDARERGSLRSNKQNPEKRHQLRMLPLSFTRSFKKPGAYNDPPPHGPKNRPYELAEESYRRLAENPSTYQGGCSARHPTPQCRRRRDKEERLQTRKTRSPETWPPGRAQTPIRAGAIQRAPLICRRVTVFDPSNSPAPLIGLQPLE